MSFDVPDACALPTAERPLRLAEFDELFATAVRGVESVSATHVRMRLTGPAGLEAQVRELAARESECCSFFTFTVTSEPAVDGEGVTVDVQVPAQYSGVLGSLAEQARAVSAGRTSRAPTGLRLEVRMPTEAADTMPAVLGRPDSSEVHDAARQP